MAAMLRAQILQTAGDFHYAVGNTILGVAEHIFHNATAFYTRNGMFNPYTDTGQLSIRGFIRGTQFTLLRFFFG